MDPTISPNRAIQAPSYQDGGNRSYPSQERAHFMLVSSTTSTSNNTSSNHHHDEPSMSLTGRIDLTPTTVHTGRRRFRADTVSLDKELQLLAGTTSSSSSEKKTVRFSMQNSEVHHVPAIERKYRDQLYWTEPQLQQIYGDCRMVAGFYNQERPDYAGSVLRLLRSHRLDARLPASPSTTPDGSEPSVAADVVRIMLESPARGLEARIVPLLKLYRKRTVRAVLELQTSLRESGCEHEKTLDKLRRKSLQASKSCRHLARQLAVGDQAVAQIEGVSPDRMVHAVPVPSAWLSNKLGKPAAAALVQGM